MILGWTERRAILLVGLTAAILGIGACSGIGRPASGPAVERDDQGWDLGQQRLWYRGSQGSRLLPESWLSALEADASLTLFMAPTNFDRFGYLPADPQDSERLPIGFARDQQSDEKLNATRLRWYSGQRNDEPWIGLNCAACHTAELRFNDTVVRIDGGATLADFQGFTGALSRAMSATFADPAKWDRFATRVLAAHGKAPSRDNGTNRAMLRTSVSQWLDHELALDKFNATDSVYGHGRLDAVGHILNKVAFLTEADNQVPGEPDAPVSYPFIWNANQHDLLQWNGIVPNDKIALGGTRNIDAGALVRNTSEVIGVFADVKLREDAGFGGYRSSVATSNLIAMEIQLGKLMSPKWPRAFGNLDPVKVRLGDRLFKQRCAGCHAELGRGDLTTPIKAEMTPIWAPLGVGTDPWMACNAFSYLAQGGVLTGTKDKVVAGTPQPSIGPTRGYLKTEAVGVLLGHKWQVLVSALKILSGREPRITTVGPPPPPPPPFTAQASREERLQACIAAANSLATPPDELRLLAYKARPLNGVWATAPFLHNGSVRSLYDLLLPPDERSTLFWVGNRKFDPVDVGYVNEASTFGSWFRTKDGADHDIHGNSNQGHDYGNRDFSKKERYALIEYMKTL